MLNPIPRGALILALGALLAAAAPAHANTAPQPDNQTPDAQTPVAQAPPAEQALGVGDRIAIRVFGRPEISGEFGIGPLGMIRFPLVGAVKAAGRAPGDVEQDLAAHLSERLDYAVQVSLDVQAYAPIFVVGEVGQPGPHPFRPGMTVLQAFATAGGQPSVRHLPSDQSMEASAAQSRLRQAHTRLRALLVSQAALDAALAGAEKITLPPELQAVANAPSVLELLKREQDIITADRESLESIRVALNRQYAQLEEEVAALINEGKALSRQQAFISREVANMQSLRDKGLTTSARMLDLEQSLSGIEATRHRQAAYLTRARQQQVRLERALEEARQTWRRDLLQRRLDNVAAIEIAQAELEATKDRMVALSVADTSLSDLGLGPMRLVFTILRGQDGKTIEVAAEGSMAMRPGDVLEVKAEAADPAAAMSAVPSAQRVTLSN